MWKKISIPKNQNRPVVCSERGPFSIPEETKAGGDCNLARSLRTDTEALQKEAGEEAGRISKKMKMSSVSRQIIEKEGNCEKRNISIRLFSLLKKRASHRYFLTRNTREGLPIKTAEGHCRISVWGVTVTQYQLRDPSVDQI